MSFRATAQALAVTAPSATSKLVLVVLASYAGEEGTCWPSQARVAEDAQLSLRTVRDAYRDLKAAGLIEAAPRRRADGSRTTDLIRLSFLGPAKGQTAPQPKRQMAPEHEAGGAGLEPAREPITQEPSTEARAQDDLFEEGWAAYPEAGRQTSSRRQGRAAWAAEVRSGGDPRAMVAAARAYAAAKGRWGRSGSPLAFHNFLSLGRWIDCVPAAGAAPAAVAAGGFEGPAELVAALTARLGAAGFASWTAGARWREGDRTVVARTAHAAAVLADRCRVELRALEARVEGPARPSG